MMNDRHHNLGSLSFNLDSGGMWFPPAGWTGPDAALYRSFDNMIGLVLVEGIKQRTYVPLTHGQV